jgi:hypothetical protein
MMRVLASSLFFLGGLGCLARPPAPPVPEQIVPAKAVAVVPSEPPAANSGRVILDAVNEQAKVYDVTEVTTRSMPTYRRKGYPAVPMEETKMRPLCITPCVVDIPQGWHTLVFASQTDETKTSSADITVPAQPIAVRHALGREKPISSGYVGGAVMLLPGAGFTLMGGVATAIGATARQPETDSSGKTKSDPKTFLTLGIVLLGVGAALGITGGILMANNRPEKQAGSTTQWVLP